MNNSGAPHNGHSAGESDLPVDEVTCRQFVELVTDYFEGELQGRTLSQVEEHLVMCDWCVTYVEQMQATIGLLRRARGTAPAGAFGFDAVGLAGEEDGRSMIAYKFLRSGRVGPFSAFPWPEPGVWVHAPRDLTACRRGIHACRPSDLPWWLSDELWEVELDGQVQDDEHKVIAPAGRLRSQIDGVDAGMRSGVRGRMRMACAGTSGTGPDPRRTPTRGRRARELRDPRRRAGRGAAACR